MKKSTKRTRVWLLTLALSLVLAISVFAPSILANAAPDNGFNYDYADGSQLWLRYVPVSDATLMAAYREAATAVLVQNVDMNKTFRATQNLAMSAGSKERLVESSLEAARDELVRGLSGLLDKDIATIDSLADGAVVVGTPETSPIIASLGIGGELEGVGAEGYIIRSMTVSDCKVTVIAGKTDIGALYGTYTFLSQIQTQKPISGLNIVDKPKFNNRQLNNWEMGGGSGAFLLYTGTTGLPAILDRYIVFARTAASIGVNELSINMINANDVFLGVARLTQVAALADALRPYGIKLLIAINYTAPSSTNTALDQAMRVTVPAPTPTNPNAVAGNNDPFSSDYQNWWTYKTIQITELIPDFVGYTVKANSEGTPGPQQYGYTHGDGANGIANAVAYKGDFRFRGFERDNVDLNVKVFWRTFVYEAKVDPDRLKRPYMEFGYVNDDVRRGAYVKNDDGKFLDVDGNILYAGDTPTGATNTDMGCHLDEDGNPLRDGDFRYRLPVYDEDGDTIQGGFMPNAYIQTKNGPLDFQPVEPVHSLFGLMDNTTQVLEVEVYQEYTGSTTYPCFLGTMWERVLKWETNAEAYLKDAKGNYILDADGKRIIEKKNALVGEILDASFQGQSDSGMVGVCNLDGSPSLCTSQQMSQANWYTFGRQSWDWTLNAEDIADDWVRMTWSNDQAVVDTIKGIMLETIPAIIAYQNPLGTHHQFNLDSHPTAYPWEDRTQDDWDAVYYAKADSVGVGYNRTSEGSNMYVPASGYVDQYFEPLRSTLANIDTCPEEILAWFHHVPWDRVMQSGRTYWDEMVYRYQMGVQAVTWMNDAWGTLEGYMSANGDSYRYNAVRNTLVTSERDAARWRDVMVYYFQQFSEKPIPVNDAPLSISVTAGGKTFQDFNLSVDPFARTNVLGPSTGGNGQSGEPGFDVPKYYTIGIPYGEQPTITAVTPLQGASYEIVQQASDMSGEAIVKVSNTHSIVGNLVKYYHFRFVYDTTLSGIQIKGRSLLTYKPNILAYNLHMAPATVTAQASDPHATVAISGNDIIVTNEGEQTVYTVNFTEPFSMYEDFSSESLGDEWSWVREAPDRWSLDSKPGHLTINAQTGDLAGRTTNNAQNILLRDISGYSWVAETKVSFSKILSSNFEQAGIIAYLDDDNYVKASWMNQNTGSGINMRNRRMIMNWEVNGTNNFAAPGGNLDNATYFSLTAFSNYVQPDDYIYLRLAKKGNEYIGYFSFDGIAWRWMGQHSAEWTADVEPVKIGLFAYAGTVRIQGTTGAATAYAGDLFASFDYFSAKSAGADESVINLSVAADEKTPYGDKAAYTFSAANMEAINLAEITFEVDSDFLQPDAILEGLNGFSVFQDVAWTNLGGSRWQGKFILGIIGNGQTRTGDMDLASIRFNGAKLGNASLAITSAVFYGIDIDGGSVGSTVRPHVINPASATTKIFSIYDINDDSLVDYADLSIAFYYYMSREGDSDWDEAKVADVNGDGRVDMGDLIEIYANFLP